MRTTRLDLAGVLACLVGAALVGGCLQPGLDGTDDDAPLAPLARRADPLSLVPASAPLVFGLTSIGEFDSATVELMRSSWLPLANGWLLQQLEAVTGGALHLQPDSPLLVIVPDAAAYTDSDGRGFVVLVQVDATAADVPSEVELFGEVLHVRQLEGYVLLGRDAERLAAFTPAAGTGDSVRSLLAAGGAAAVDRAEGVLIMNVGALEDTLREELASDLASAATWLGRIPGGLDAADTEALLNTYETFASVLLRDSRSVALTLDIEPVGVELAGALDLRDGSPLADLVGRGGEAAPLLEALPDGPFTAAMVADLTGFDAGTLADWLTPELVGGGDVADLVRGWLEVFEGVDSLAVASYTAPEGSEAEPVLVVAHGDGAARMPDLIERHLRYLEGSTMWLTALYDAEANEVSTEATRRVVYEAEAGSAVDRALGADLARWSVDYEIAPEYLELARAQGGDQWLPRGFSGLFGAADDRAVLAVNTDDAWLADALTQPAASPRLDSRADLSALRAVAAGPGLFLEAYIDLAQTHAADEGAAPSGIVAIFGRQLDHELTGQVLLPVELVRSLR